VCAINKAIQMPLTAKELLARDAKRDIGAELLQSVREMKAGAGAVAYQFKSPNATTPAATADAEKITVARRMFLKNTA
jgi:putative transcriptional regulator